MGATARDVISILQAIKAAGALDADWGDLMLVVSRWSLVARRSLFAVGKTIRIMNKPRTTNDWRRTTMETIHDITSVHFHPTAGCQTSRRESGREK